MKETSGKFNVSDLIDNTAVGRFHVGLCALLGACLISDGFDVQAMGYVAPALLQDWHIARSALGPVFSAALLGILVGSLGFSVVADKVGRRPILIGCTFFFGITTILTGFATTMTELLIIRFIAGMGLGGIVPNTSALIGEYGPSKSRVAMLMITGNGFNIGAAFGGFIAG